ncbi:MAG: glutamate--cysteine ligase [Alphaproteobacteria bacterium]
MSETITNKQQLIDYFYNACKPKEQWRIGTEHEKFLFNKETKKRLTYDGDCSIKTILEKMQNDYFTPITEDGNIIGLKGKNGDSVTLEPGGQFELSGAPLKNIHETCMETNKHLTEVRKICDEIGAIAISLGYDPVSAVEDIKWMPKGRYGLMKRYMPTKGNSGTSMMTLSCTVQVNLDYSSQEDMVKKMQVGFALQPLATAIFANSTIVKGKSTDYQSYRSELWKDTDPDRCGIPEFIFDDDMSFEKWTDYILDVPMYFVYRDGVYHDVLGLSFRDFMDGKLKGFEGELPTIKDWEDHLTVAFPEVRMKGFIEMRGADNGAWDKLCALPAFWVGLLYDEETLDQVYEYIKQFDKHDIIKARDDVTKSGFDTKMGNKTIHEIGIDIIDYAYQGLEKRDVKNADGYNETKFLDSIKEVIDTKKTYADISKELLIENENNINVIFDEYSY